MRNINFKKRKKAVRAKIFGTHDRPRMSVFRSNRELYVQLVDDIKGKTLIGLTSKGLKEAKGVKTKVDTARLMGVKIAKLAKSKKISKVVFDRGGFKYHGRIKALAEGAREGGLIF